MIGTMSEEIKRSLDNAVTVDPEIMARYVGTYDLRLPENPTTPMLVPIRVEGGRLLMGDGPMIPLSPTVFAAGPNRVEFIADERA